MLTKQCKKVFTVNHKVELCLLYNWLCVHLPAGPRSCCSVQKGVSVYGAVVLKKISTKLVSRQSLGFTMQNGPQEIL